MIDKILSVLLVLGLGIMYLGWSTDSMALSGIGAVLASLALIALSRRT